MPIYHTLGQIPRKRHIAFRKPDGGIYAEELVGHEGFTGTSSLVYHIHPPTTVKSARRLRETKFEAEPDSTLRHRHFLTSRTKKGGSVTLDRMPILFNQDIAMLYIEPDENDAHFYRNAQADELIYICKGKGTLETTYGSLPFHEGDYLIIHRGILHRYRFDLTGEQPKVLIFESRGHVRWPKAYRTEFGQFKEGAPYSASSEFMSRKGIEFGSITHHPDGIPHGPHPGRAEASIGAKYTDELAVMMDSFHPLKVAKRALEIEDPNYHKSWLLGQHAPFNPPTS